jgi:ribosomal protein S18 acetylase RimI-like enzyme
MTTIRYSTTHDAIDWARLKDDLAADDFDNGRTPAQLEHSFRNSFRCVYALDGARIVGTARALSDGVCNAYVVDMWSHSAYRRRGIGRRMLDLLCEPFEGQHVFLFTDEHEAFYAACGFVPRGTGMERVIGTWLKNASAA